MVLLNKMLMSKLYNACSTPLDPIIALHTKKLPSQFSSYPEPFYRKHVPIFGISGLFTPLPYFLCLIPFSISYVFFIFVSIYASVSILKFFLGT